MDNCINKECQYWGKGGFSNCKIREWMPIEYDLNKCKDYKPEPEKPSDEFRKRVKITLSFWNTRPPYPDFWNTRSPRVVLEYKKHLKPLEDMIVELFEEFTKE